MTILRFFIHYFNLFCMFYTLLLSAGYVVQLAVSYIRIVRDRRQSPADDFLDYSGSDNLPPVSVLVPAYNEQENLVQNVRDLLNLNYPEFEVIVVNDGSTDGTHDRMVAAFGLYPIEYAMRISVPTQAVRGVYYNPDHPRLIYVDKENGGKSDALNAGINMSVYPLFACLDADSRLEKDAVLRLATEFIRDSKTVVAGGMVRIANGSVIEDGEWKSFRIPDRAVEKFQMVEYFRAFLSGRISWGMTNSLLIVSGAFGVFNKQVVIDCGGYKRDTIGEDMEIVLNIHEKMRQKGRKYRVVMREDAVCWTQGPMSMRDLRSQRRRWQIGLMDSLLRHKRMILNPGYGFVGLVSVPYSWLFELLGAPIEVFGYFLIPLALLMGELSWYYFILYLALAIALGIILSFGGLILEQKTGEGRMTARQCLRLTRYALLENFGYRQAITVFRTEGMLRFRSLRRSWGKIRREEFNRQQPSND